MTDENTRIRELYKHDLTNVPLRRRSSEMLAPVPEAEGPLANGHEEVIAPRLASSSTSTFGSEPYDPDAETPEALADAAPTDESATAAGTLDEELAIDAYWASYGDAPTRAMMRTRSAREAVLEVVIGPDDRVQRTDTDRYPWRAVASLIITARTGMTYIGTGWFVAPRTVVTAGHCVFLHDEGGWPRQIEVIPGRNGSNRPFGAAVSTAVRSVRGWTESRSSEYDYGAIILPEDQRLGERVGTFGYQVMETGSLENLTVNLSGYPGDKPSGTQWWQANDIDQVTDRRVTYQIDTYGGQSGAPVWAFFTDGSRRCVSIHTNGHITGNSGVRINSDVAGMLANWQTVGA